MGRNPFPYRGAPLLYIPQCLLEMHPINNKKCHFVYWTPRRTSIYLMKRDKPFIQMLPAQFKCFWDEAQIGEVLTWNMNLEFLKTEA